MVAHPLRTWREANGISRAHIAAVLGIHGSSPIRTVQRWETYERTPNVRIIRAVEELTCGAVTLADFVPPDEVEQPQKRAA